MARPKSNNVDYFPCYCKDGKVLYILESRWGNDGYAFFYKLWKRLGDADFHYIDLRPLDNWEYFRAKMGVSDTETHDILDKLSEMGVIDPELWAQKVIWSESFIESVKDVWIKRKQLIPQKPLFLTQKQELLEQNETETTVNENQNPQSKVNKSKVNKSKVNNNPPYSPPKINFENNRFTDIPDALMEKWREVAPGINIGDEIKKAELWLLANPQKRRSRYNSFLSTWMVRAQDHFIKYGGNGNGSGNTRPGYSGSTGTAHAKAGNAQSDGTPWPADREY